MSKYWPICSLLVPLWGFCGKCLCIVSWGNSIMWAFDLQTHDKHLSWPVMPVEWGGETKWQNRLWPVLVYLLWVGVCVCVCVCVSVCLCLLGQWHYWGAGSHRRPDAWLAGLGLAKARLAGSGDSSVPFKCGSSAVEQVTWIWRQ